MDGDIHGDAILRMSGVEAVGKLETEFAGCDFIGVKGKRFLVW